MKHSCIFLHAVGLAESIDGRSVALGDLLETLAIPDCMFDRLLGPPVFLVVVCFLFLYFSEFR